GFALYLVPRALVGSIKSPLDSSPVAVLPDEYSYLSGGDIVRLVPGDGRIRVLYRKRSTFNAILVTEQCDNYCLMCSQPPKATDDAWIADEILEMLPLVDIGARELCFSGGEPALLGDRLIAILRCARAYLPRTSIHILSNGRRFHDRTFA